MVRRATALACLAIFAFAPAAHAANPPAGWVDRMTVDFASNHARGQVLVDQLSAGSARVSTALGKLMPNRDYRLMFSDDLCSVPLNQADIGLTINLHANSVGASFQSVVNGADLSLWRTARSARLMEDEGIYYFCVSPRRLHDVTQSQGEGSTGRFADGTRRGLTSLRVDGHTMRWSLRGLEPGARYSVLVSQLTCKQIQHGAADQPILIGSFRADPNGLAVGRTETVDNNETITVGRSARLERSATGADWGCATLKAYAAW